jgi:tetratricopeptide (TPR) repeat protein
LQISKEIGDRQGEGSELGNLGNACKNLGEYKKAIDFYKQALQISKEIGDLQNEGIWLGNLGTTYLNLDEKEKACGLWKEALAIFEAIESPNANVIRQLLKEYCN